MGNLLMNKGLKKTIQTLSYIGIGVASVMGAAQADEPTQKLIKAFAAKVIKK